MRKTLTALILITSTLATSPVMAHDSTQRINELDRMISDEEMELHALDRKIIEDDIRRDASPLKTEVDELNKRLDDQDEERWHQELEKDN